MKDILEKNCVLLTKENQSVVGILFWKNVFFLLLLNYSVCLV